MNLIWPELETLEHFLATDESIGFCLRCGEEVESVEPDAEAFLCSKCNHYTLYGLDSVLSRYKVSETLEEKSG